jgi:hypothetical protein
MSYLRFNHLAYVDEDPAEAEARERRERMAAFDRLPEPLRAAMRECQFDVHIMMQLGRYTDPAPMIERVRSIRNERDAIAFNEQYAQAGTFRRRWG